MSKRHWFAPGPVPSQEIITIDCSHRSKQFSFMYKETVELLQQLTGKKIVLIQGSASAAIEAVLRALPLRLQSLMIVNTGTFSQRVVDWARETPYPDLLNFVFAEVHSVADAVYSIKGDKFTAKAVYVVQFETSASNYQDLKELATACRSRDVLLIVDAVSAFPYYPIPSLADVVILSSSKQLRGLPVMGIVAYNPEQAVKLSGKDHSYTSLKKAIEYGTCGQTPHTSLMPQILSLHRSLKDRLWGPGVGAIGTNAEVVSEGLEDRLVGESIAPVLTFESKNVTTVISLLEKEGLDVYYNPAYLGNRFQVSCYNYQELEPYDRLNQELLKLREDGWL